MSLRRPTVALLLFTFDISPLCDVAQTSDCGIIVIYFHYKPFSRCRLDARLWHVLLFTFQYKPFMWCRLDARLRHVEFVSTFRGVASDTRSVFSYFYWDFGRTTTWFPHIYRAVQIYYLIVHTDLLMCIMFTFVISYVRTVLRVHSKYSPGLLIWPDVDEGDLMDEEFDSESDA